LRKTAAGHANEVYFRYLADLGLIAGNPDGSFGPNNTLTRAEASALFEKANGYSAAMLLTAPPSVACTFTDVSASDWFAGWVWQACDDGFMNGLGGGQIPILLSEMPNLVPTCGCACLDNAFAGSQNLWITPSKLWRTASACGQYAQLFDKWSN